jgi:cell division protein ZapA (FtsZ GTPase activity inhibitor)
LTGPRARRNVDEGDAVKRSVTVEVAGQRLQLRTDAEDAYVTALAEYVNVKIGEIKASSRTYSTHVLAVLAALHIADDLFQVRRRESELREQVRERSRRILELLKTVETPETPETPENGRDA